MIIYKTTNLINGKIYIGQNSNNDPKYFGSGLLLTLAIKKYGIENFIKEILEECESKELLNEKEKYWISFYNSRNLKIGYNLSEGGTGGKLVDVEAKKGKTYDEYYGIEKSTEIKNKLSKVRKGKKLKYKNITAKEVGEKISRAKKGNVKPSQEHKDKISISLKTYYQTDNGLLAKENTSKRCKNKKLSEEHISNIKKSMIGIKPKKLEVPPSARYWFFYDKDNNLILEILGGRTKALKELKTNHKRIVKFDNLEECLNYNIQDKKNIDYKLYYKKYYNKNKFHILSENKKYRENHKEEKKEYAKKYYENHKERYRENGKQYDKSEKGKLKKSLIFANRREKSKKLVNNLTLNEWHDIIKNQENKCKICGKPFGDLLKPTKDHIIPVTRQKIGGDGLTKKNTQALCGNCNSRKNNRLSLGTEK